MRFYDLIMQSREVPAAYKNKLDGCTVIVADNVASYYYEGTDKEHWDLSDFPNVAPPFERFWLECKAPDKCVSAETGTRAWDWRMPSYWGFYVKAMQIESLEERFSTKEGVTVLAEEIEKRFSALHKSIQVQVPDYFNMVHDKGMDYVKEHTSEKQYTMIAEAMMIVQATMHIKNGDLTQAKEALAPLFDFKWFVIIELTQRMYFEHADQFMVNCWNWQMYVKADGSVMPHKDTGIPAIMASAQNDMARVLENLMGYGMEYQEAMQVADNSVNPYLHTLLLSMSFLHCKNVALETTTPPKHIVRNKAAKRRGDKDFQPVTFKTLDIRPMRQILRTEGGEEKHGTQKALSICRGHFKDYSNGRGLFGKYKGTFWFPQQLRGSADRGTVVKDYRLKGPFPVIGDMKPSNDL